MFRADLLFSTLLCSCVLVPAVSGFGCGGSSPGGRTIIVLNGENEELNAYDAADPTHKQVLIKGGETEKIAGPSSVNGEICFDPTNPRHFVMADDNLNPNPPNHFAVYDISGNTVGALSVTKIVNLTPTYQKATSGYGCYWRKDGSLLTSDQGNQDSGPGNGQLVLWFPPFDGTSAPHYCKLDIAIATSGQIYVDEQDRIYISSARLEPGVYRYPGPLPTGDDAAHGCTGTDPMGSPYVQATRERFIVGDQTIPTPTGVARTPTGTFFISSVLNGVIAEYDANGHYLRTVLAPPKGEILANGPYSTGTPYGITVDSQGTIYYADIGLTFAQGMGSIDYANGLGSLRMLRFVNGQPQAPVVMEDGLDFPDGVGVLEP